MKRALRVISNSPQDTDHQLLARSKAGDSAAFEELLKRHQSRLFSVAVKMMKDRDLASELVQEALFRAYKNLSKHSGTGSVKAWLTRITVNTCLNEIRKRKRLVFSEHSMESWLAVDEKSNPEHRFQAQELRGKSQRRSAKIDSSSPSRSGYGVFGLQL